MVIQKEQSDPQYNREVRLGIFAWMEYQRAKLFDNCALTPEEWIKENEDDQRKQGELEE